MTHQQNQPRRVWWRRGRDAKGWRKPDNTVAITRRTPWGNPFRVTKDRPALMAVSEFSKMVMDDPDYQARCRQHLQGKNLMCFCKPDQPCHADVLLQVANSPSMTPSEQMAVVQDGGSNSSNSKGDYQSKEVGHDLLAVEELKSRIDDHGNDDPVEESPEDRQAKNDKEDRDGGSFDDGLRAISHVTPTGNRSHYDTGGICQF